MNRSALRFLTTGLAAAAMLLPGCRKKDSISEVAEEAEAALPTTEQVVPPTKEATSREQIKSDPALRAHVAAGNSDFEAWFKKYGLDLNDPKMLDADPDGDGFSNRDEFLADTNPLDPNSHPGIHKTIRLKEFTEVRLPLVVEGVEGHKARLRRTDGEGKLETLKAGDTVHGLPLRVEKVEEIHDTDKEGKPIDRSLVTLEDTGSKERLTLVKDMPARSAASFAVLTSPDGATNLKVKQGDTFKWPGDDTANYRVIDLREDQIVLQEMQSKKMWTITRGPAPAPNDPPKAP